MQFFSEDDANVVAIAKAGEAISCALVVKNTANLSVSTTYLFGAFRTF